MQNNPSKPDCKWIRLKEKKAFSRLLYTNPVCFLTTRSRPNTTDEVQDFEGLGEKNVMTISWLTATNNSGRFVFSINRRRHTAGNLVANSSSSPDGTCEFVLSIPVKGMEDLVKDVGRTSGRWGSKFCNDHVQSSEKEEMNGVEEQQVSSDKVLDDHPHKMKKKNPFARGVPGLCAVPYGHEPPKKVYHEKKLVPQHSISHCFAIEGTVAHLKCRIYSIMDDVVDEDHHLCAAEVVSAYVHPSYWNRDKKRFQPRCSDTAPYLTFFGSQAFGYVINDTDDTEVLEAAKQK